MGKRGKIEVPGSLGLVSADGTPVPRREYGEIRVPNIRIVGPRLLVLPKPRQEEVLESGIVIPEYAQDQVQEGVVLLTGDGLLLENAPWVQVPGEDGKPTGMPSPLRLPSSVQPGDAIIYARYAGVELELEKVKYLIIAEADVRVVLSYKGKVFEYAD